MTAQPACHDHGTRIERERIWSFWKIRIKNGTNKTHTSPNLAGSVIAGNLPGLHHKGTVA
jgi:hypothetical protein